MENSSNKTIKYLLVALGIVLVVLCVALFGQYMSLRRLQIISARQFRLSFHQSHKPLTVNDINLIQSWMTFDYLNLTFNLPLDYLKTKLSISDTNYPHVSLGHYAKEQKVDANTFLAKVKEAIHNYSISSNQ